MNRDARTPGTLFVVGLGPGSAGLLTPDAASAIDAADTVVGYRGYLDLIAPRLEGKQVVGRQLGEEVERARTALELAGSGRTVALVSSGDAGIYGMGGVVWELAARGEQPAEIIMVPGVTAACSAAAKLGAPLAHDWASISLSDLLTPWEVIVGRVDAAARADFVLALYNPKSRTRARQLAAVAERILAYRDPETPVGLVDNAYRPGERVEIVTLRALARDEPDVTMFTTVIVGSSRTFVAGGRMITPRIYAAKENREATDASHPLAATNSGPGDAIMAESLAIIDRELGPEPSDPVRRAIVRRVIHASADFEFARLLRFGPGAVEAALRAFRAEDVSAPVVLCDVEMLRAGVRRDLAGPLGLAAVCHLNDPECTAVAAAGGLTRSAAGIRLAALAGRQNAVVAVGNAPTALEEVLRLVREAGWRPACVIGIPVGFVGVEASKERLIEECRSSGVPYITSLGRKGGTAVTAAVVNALLELAGDRRGLAADATG